MFQETQSEGPVTVPFDEMLRLALPDLARADRQLASHILTKYPVAALGLITTLVWAAGGHCFADRPRPKCAGCFRKYFEAFAESGFYAAFMTTSAFGAQAFRDVPFPILRAAGCRHIVVLADRQITNQSYAEYRPPRVAGSTCRLIKAVAPGALHPKITMLVGPKKGRLMIECANLTAVGLGGSKALVDNIMLSSG